MMIMTFCCLRVSFIDQGLKECEECWSLFHFYCSLLLSDLAFELFLISMNPKLLTVILLPIHSNYLGISEEAVSKLVLSALAFLRTKSHRNKKYFLLHEQEHHSRNILASTSRSS